MRVLGVILLNGFFVFLAAALLPGVAVVSYWQAVWVGLILGLINYTVKPFVTLLTLPITLLTFGLFLFIINGAMVLLVDGLLQGFQVHGILWAILFSLLLSTFNFFLGHEKFLGQKK